MVPPLNFDRFLYTAPAWCAGIAILAGITMILSISATSVLEGAIRCAYACIRTSGMLWVFLLATILYSISWYAFNHKPLLVDAVVQLFQAQVFANGQVAAAPFPLPAFIMGQHVLFEPSGVFAQYPPGLALVLSPFVSLGVPYLGNIVLTVTSAVLISKATARLYGEPAAIIARIIILISPFFWCLGVSYMSHELALTGTSLVTYSFSGIATATGNTPPKTRYFVLLGMGIGLIFLSRPLVGLITGTLLFAYTFPVLNRRFFIATALPATALMSIFFLYNWITLGNPLLPGYIKLWGAGHELGFHKDPWGEFHTPLKGLALQLYNLHLLNEYLFESCIPGLYLLAIPLLCGISLSIVDNQLFGLFFSLPVIYICYWHQDSFLGPRFLYEGLAFLIPVMATLIVRTCEHSQNIVCRFGVQFNLANYWKTSLIVAAAIGLLNGMPSRLEIYATGMNAMKGDILKEAGSQGIKDGIVFIATSWGDRIISTMRGLGLSASLSEQVYRKVDHCLLWTTLLEASSAKLPVARLEEFLTNQLQNPKQLSRPAWNKDVTLRVDPEKQLTDRCVNEIEYDRRDNAGYTVYAPHLLANHARWDGRLLFLRDLREQNNKILALYPGRKSFIYRGRIFHEQS